MTSPDPISEYPGVQKALTGQVPCPAAEVGSVLETQGLRRGMLRSCKRLIKALLEEC